MWGASIRLFAQGDAGRSTHENESDEATPAPRPVTFRAKVSTLSRTEKIVLGGVLAAMGVSWTWMASPASAEQDTVESVALEIARQHNQSASAMLDEMTLSTSARAIGKNVVLTYVIRVQRGLSEQNLAEFKTELEREIVPAACKRTLIMRRSRKGSSTRSFIETRTMRN